MSCPSIILFGPQINQPSLAYISLVRQYLLREPHSKLFLKAIRNLPIQWEALIASDERLSTIGGAKAIQEILQWLDFGQPCWDQNVPPATFTTPFTIIIHFAQYFNFLHLRKGTTNQAGIIKNLRLGGIQGFCTGLLSAVAVACSADEKDVVANAAIALRIALGVGAYIDLCSPTGAVGKSTCLAVQWKAGSNHNATSLIDGYPDAYVSVICDLRQITISGCASTIDLIEQELSTEDVVTKRLNLRGLFHTSQMEEGMKMLNKFCDSNNSFSFPDASKLLAPLRSNSDASIVSHGSLHQLALRSMMTELCNWHKTVIVSLGDLSHLDIIQVALFSLGDFLPHSAIRESGQKIAKIDGSKLFKNLNSTLPPLTPEYASFNHKHGKYKDNAIAIVGMACRFPGADSTEEFWRIIQSATKTLGKMPAGRFDHDQLHRAAGWKSFKEGIFNGNYLRDPGTFDQRFFKKSSREAASMDPQQRLLLHVTYEALESAGYHGNLWNSSKDDVGCFIGVASSDYEDNVSSHPPNAFSLTGTQRAFLSGKLSHHYCWTAPSITYDTACSSSLVAIHSACKSIQGGECTSAVAGGVNVISSPNLHLNLAGGSFLSPGGSCKPFDAKADGYSRSEGAGIVVLKLLSQALADKDMILGVIAGSAVNQNENVCGITVPHLKSQMSLYEKVSGLSGIQPSEVSYVEAHGTGTVVGDPIECESVRKVFGGSHRSQPLYIGSVKGNIGHAEAASGVASLIKTILMIRHRLVPPQASFTSLNPNIPPLEPDNMAISTISRPWEASFLAACVSNYGASGSNAALLICEPPLTTPHKDATLKVPSNQNPSSYPITISGHSATALFANIKVLQKYISQLISDSQISTTLADLAFNIAKRRNGSLPLMWGTVSSSLAELHANIETRIENDQISSDHKTGGEAVKPLVLVFGPQTGTTVGLNKDIYEQSTLLRSHLNHCDQTLKLMGLDRLYPMIFESTPYESLVSLHCALFSLQYSCARSWIDSGLKVRAVLGHSFGELTSLAVCGVLSLEDGLKLISGRARIMEQKWGREPGAMIAIEADFETVQKLLSHFADHGPGGQIEIACHNGPLSHILVGSVTSIDGLCDLLRKNLPQLVVPHIKFTKMKVARGFHSEFTDILLPEIYKLAAQLNFRQASIELETCTEGETCITIEAQTIARHTRNPVFFSQAVKRLADRLGPSVWLEAGADSPVLGMVRNILGQSGVPAASKHITQAVKFKAQDVVSSLANTTLNLLRAGNDVEFWLHHRSQVCEYKHIELPPYQFDRQHHWLEYVDSPGVKQVNLHPGVGATVNLPLVLFSSFRDNKSQDAQFSINPKHEIFEQLTVGHSVVNFPLCPASLYLEVVESGLRLIVSDLQDLMVCFQDTCFKSPLGLKSEDVVLSLMLSRVRGTPSEWTWAIESRDNAETVLSKKSPSPTLHATGRIKTNLPNGTEVTYDFSRYGRLVTYDRLQALLDVQEGQSIRGSLIIYKIFSSIVDYADFFQGMQYVSSKGNEITGQVVLPKTKISGLNQTISDPVILDSFIQVAGLHMNVFNAAVDKDHMFITAKIDIIQASDLFKQRRKQGQESWSVYSTCSKITNVDYVYDIFVFEPQTKELVLMIIGVQFTKISFRSVKNILARTNLVPSVVDSNPPPPIHQCVQNNSAGNAISPSINRHMDSPAQTTNTVFAASQRPSCPRITASAVCTLLGSILDIPLTELSGQTILDSLGIDSLMMTEVIGEIRSGFNVDIPVSLFSGLKNINSLVHSLQLTASDEHSNIDITTPFHSISIEMESEIDESQSVDVLISLKNLVSLLFVPSTPIVSNTSLEELGMDSLMVIELVSEINAFFEIKLESTDIDNESTFGDLTTIVTSHMDSNTPSRNISTTSLSPIAKIDSDSSVSKQPFHSYTARLMETMETVTYKRVGGLHLCADIYYPPQNLVSLKKRPVALMIHGGGHTMLSRKDIQLRQTYLLLELGFLPVSIDYRLCPEVTLLEGPMVDACDALRWARFDLPKLVRRRQKGFAVDGENVVAVGWSTGGTLAMSLAWIPQQSGLKPVQGILAFYCPSDYEDPCWRTPNLIDKFPSLLTEQYNIEDGVQNTPILGYNVPVELQAEDGWMSLSDSRSRIPLMMNVKALTLPVLVRGLPSKSSSVRPKLDMPSIEEIVTISPRAQIDRGNYQTPTCIIHGTKDDLIPWQQAKRTHKALVSHGVSSKLSIIQDAVHLFDLLLHNGDKEWATIEEGYLFLASCITPFEKT